jgi:hypothetical protein
MGGSGEEDLIERNSKRREEKSRGYLGEREKGLGIFCGEIEIGRVGEGRRE